MGLSNFHVASFVINNIIYVVLIALAMLVHYFAILRKNNIETFDVSDKQTKFIHNYNDFLRTTWNNLFIFVRNSRLRFLFVKTYSMESFNFINFEIKFTILLLVYTSFCDSFQQHIWSGHSSGQIWFVLIISIALFVFAMGVMAVVSGVLHFTREDKIAAMFCGSKKTLASGVPMAKLIFGAHPGLGLILLPIMIYHPLQLVICGVLAERWRKE